jgi:hypothetical protein
MMIAIYSILEIVGQCYQQIKEHMYFHFLMTINLILKMNIQELKEMEAMFIGLILSMPILTYSKEKTRMV